MTGTSQARDAVRLFVACFPGCYRAIDRLIFGGLLATTGQSAHPYDPRSYQIRALPDESSYALPLTDSMTLRSIPDPETGALD